ncbi:MAG: two-component sensor histidine kinase [Prevotellaceae bacterium]|jgi:signal transduction histidine kinase|nr:two-component sensor histidine kinase [Prevotellaceae bacterium]
MKLSYKQRLFLCFFVIFAAFSTGVIIIEQSEGRKHKTEALKDRLASYAGVANMALMHRGSTAQILDSLTVLFPKNIRLTLLDALGNVIYDNIVGKVGALENHAARPEIVMVREKGEGSNIRASATNHVEYLYYAKRYGSYYIRVALPYDIQTKKVVESYNIFFYYTIALFAAMLLLMNFVAGRFSKSIKQLRDFTWAIESGDPVTFDVDFPQDELGEIGAKIAENYEQLNRSKKEVAAERERLLQHVHSSEEGLCFFSANRTVEFYNGLFIQYLNTIVDEAGCDPLAIFSDHAFDKIAAFLSGHSGYENYFEAQIFRQGKHFTVRVNIFEDKSFEVVINDITKQEKTRLMKQEMTGNIAHELRTPVAGIRGYLETMLSQRLDPEKQRYFLSKAYNQALSLSELIQDMGLITKIEELPQSFHLEPVDINQLLKDLKADLEVPLQEKEVEMKWNISDNAVVNGNRNLIYSIFRNLTDNAIRHAGNGITICISEYNEDKDFCYFSFSDNGVGIPDERHLNRLFERFYRVNEGRTRGSGGSGLGLSIVKNAVLFHKGAIVAKNAPSGGLEFLFKLPKVKAESSS